jgi:hypothetical protein
LEEPYIQRAAHHLRRLKVDFPILQLFLCSPPTSVDSRRLEKCRYSGILCSLVFFTILLSTKISQTLRPWEWHGSLRSRLISIPSFATDEILRISTYISFRAMTISRILVLVIVFLTDLKIFHPTIPSSRSWISCNILISKPVTFCNKLSNKEELVLSNRSVDEILPSTRALIKLHSWPRYSHHDLIWRHIMTSQTWDNT